MARHQARQRSNPLEMANTEDHHYGCPGSLPSGSVWARVGGWGSQVGEVFQMGPGGLAELRWC